MDPHRRRGSATSASRNSHRVPPASAPDSIIRHVTVCSLPRTALREIDSNDCTVGPCLAIAAAVVAASTGPPTASLSRAGQAFASSPGPEGLYEAPLLALKGHFDLPLCSAAAQYTTLKEAP